MCPNPIIDQIWHALDEVEYFYNEYSNMSPPLKIRNALHLARSLYNQEYELGHLVHYVHLPALKAKLERLEGIYSLEREPEKEKQGEQRPDDSEIPHEINTIIIKF